MYDRSGKTQLREFNDYRAIKPVQGHLGKVGERAYENENRLWLMEEDVIIIPARENGPPSDK